MKWIVWLFAIFISTSAFCQTDTTKKTSVLKEVVIISSPYQAMTQMPLSFSTMKKNDFSKSGYGQEASQILQQLPGISSFTDNGTGIGYSYLRLRGIDQNRLNITINGLPLNEPEDEGVYFSNFPDLLSSVSSIQIQRGVGLSKNGVAGFAGNIDFNSFQKADTEFMTGFDIGSYNTERLYIQQQVGNEKNNFFYRLSGLHTDGYKYHSGNSSASGLFQWQYHKKNNELKYVLVTGKNKNGLAWLGVRDSLIKADPKINANTNNEKGNFFQLLQQINYKKQLSTRQSLNLSGFYNYTNGDYSFDLMNFLGYPSNGVLIDYKTHSSFTGVQSNYSYASSSISFSMGIYGSLYKKTHIGLQSPGSAQLYTNYGKKNEASAFTKFMYHSGNWFAFADLQYRTTAFSYHGNVALKDFHWSFLNPLAGITWRFQLHSYIYYSIGKIQREPGRNDIFLGNDNLGKDSAGNPVFADLHSENNFSQEIGWRYEKQKLQISVNIYRMWLKNEISLNGQIGPTGLPLHSNVAKSIRQGIEIEWRYKKDHWSFYQSFSFAPHKVKEDDVNSLPVLTPRILFNNEISYSIKKLQFILQNRYQSKSYIDFADKYKLPSYYLFNLIAIYSYKHFSFSSRIMNISSQKIYTDGQLNLYGVPVYHVQSPAMFMFGITYSL